MVLISYAWHLVLGLMVWFLWFMLMYSMLSIHCGTHASDFELLNWPRLMLFITTLVSIILLTYLISLCWRTKPNVINARRSLVYFIIWISLGVYITAMGAMIVMGGMILFYPICI